MSREAGKIKLQEDEKVVQAMFSLRGNAPVYRELKVLIERFRDIAMGSSKGCLAHIVYMNANPWNKDDPVFQKMPDWGFVPAVDIGKDTVAEIVRAYALVQVQAEANQEEKQLQILQMLAQDLAKVDQVVQLMESSADRKRKAEDAPH